MNEYLKKLIESGKVTEEEARPIVEAIKESEKKFSEAAEGRDKIKKSLRGVFGIGENDDLVETAKSIKAKFDEYTGAEKDFTIFKQLKPYFDAHVTERKSKVMKYFSDEKDSIIGRKINARWKKDDIEDIGNLQNIETLINDFNDILSSAEAEKNKKPNFWSGSVVPEKTTQTSENSSKKMPWDKK